MFAVLGDAGKVSTRRGRIRGLLRRRHGRPYRGLVVRTPSGEAVSGEPRQAEAPRAPSVALVGESIDARLEAFKRRLEAVEQELREHAARPASDAHGERSWSKERREQSLRPGPAGDPREAVDEGLRALTTPRRESGTGDAD